MYYVIITIIIFLSFLITKRIVELSVWTVQ